MAVLIGLVAMTALGSLAYVSVPLALGVTLALLIALRLAAPNNRG